jgi:hypothetical protein
MKNLLAFSLVFSSCVLAELVLPQPTDRDASIVYDDHGWSARPTPAPQVELLKRALGVNEALPKRAATITSGEFLGFVAPDNTCGYVEGQFGMFCTCFSDFVV